MTHTNNVSNRAENIVERYALARKRATLQPTGKAESTELIEAYDELVTYISGLEATIAILSPDIG